MNMTRFVAFGRTISDVATAGVGGAALGIVATLGVQWGYDKWKNREKKPDAKPADTTAAQPEPKPEPAAAS